MARTARRRHGREPARNPRPKPAGRHDRARDALLHHLFAVGRRPTRAGDPSPLDGRERPSLGHGHELPRRRMPHPHRSRPSQLHNHQAHGTQPDPKGPRKGFHPPPPQSRRLGRRLPRKPNRPMIVSPDSPGHRRPTFIFLICLNAIHPPRRYFANWRVTMMMYEWYDMMGFGPSHWFFFAVMVAVIL